MNHISQRARDLFRRASQLEASERKQFLLSQAGDNIDLLDTLNQTLESDDGQSFLSGEDDDSLFAPGGAFDGKVFDGLAEELSGSRPGDLLGPYRLIERMGAGGMGEVWRASQAEPVQREVAIKLIKLGMDSKEVLERFHAERQALALMDHSNIARVYDAGISESGRSYFVMELIRGETITQFCDARHLSTQRRLQLFLLVCAAVEHAHRRGIIHRDLKPSNILVTLEGDTPVPKIIDFGIAKAVGASITSGVATRIGQWIGTPEYMSPEQADLSAHEIDTRTDVYSLGAVLYELLTGAQLFDSTNLRQSGVDEMRRRIKEERPSLPSARLSSGSGSSAQGSHRSSEPRSLAREVRGDLDWIVMKAVEKERERRYGSAHELAADIERHLRNEPVLAGPPTFSYRFSKFVRRHRLMVTASTLIIAAILVGSALATLGLVQARQAERHAQLEADKAQEINRFLRQILSSARPEGGLGRDVTVVEALHQARASIDDSFSGNPEVDSDIRSVMGATYLELGLYDEARQLLVEALAIQRQLYGDSAAEVAKTLNELARLEHAAGNLSAAEDLFAEVLEINRDIYGDEHRRVAATLNNLGMLLVHQGKQEEALAMLTDALQIKTRIFGEVHEEVTPTLNNLGLLLADMGRFDEAEGYLVRALEGNKELHGPEHGLVAINMNNLATNYSDRGDFERAESTFLEVLELKKAAFGEQHTSYGISLSNLAQTLDRQGKFDRARPLHERALEIYASTLEPTSHRIGLAKSRYGFNLLRSRRDSEAKVELEEGIALLEAAFGADDPRTREARETLDELLVNRAP